MFDYTPFQAFLQIFIELSATFLVLDRYHFLFRLQQGLIDDVRNANQSLEDDAQKELKTKADTFDSEWIRKKGKLRSARNLCKLKIDEENDPEKSAFWNSLAPPIAVVSIMMCMFLLYAFAEIKTYESMEMINSVVLVAQCTLITVSITVYFYLEVKNPRPYWLIAIAVAWELIAIVLGTVLGYTGFYIDVIEHSWIPTIFCTIVWFPIVTLLLYVYKLLRILLKMKGNYMNLKYALNEFKTYNKKKCNIIHST